MFNHARMHTHTTILRPSGTRKVKPNVQLHAKKISVVGPYP